MIDDYNTCTNINFAIDFQLAIVEATFYNTIAAISRLYFAMLGEVIKSIQV